MADVKVYENTTGSQIRAEYSASFYHEFQVDSAGNLKFMSLTSERMRLTAAGILLLGTTTSSGASAGDVVLANGNALRGVTGGSAAAMIRINANGQTEIDCHAAGLNFQNVVTAGAGALENYILINVDGVQKKLAYYANS